MPIYNWGKMRMGATVLAISCLVPLGALGCSAGDAGHPLELGVGQTSGALVGQKSGASPVDTGSRVTTTDRPVRLVKSDKFTKTPVDRVEFLEGTYRTVGSRVYLLEAIKNSDGEYRSSLIKTYLDVLKTIPAAEAASAQIALKKVASPAELGTEATK